MPLIRCHNQPFFKSYGFCLIFWISFSHLFDDFMHTHPAYIFLKLNQHGDFIIILSKWSTQHGDPLGKTFFVLVHLCIFHPITATHFTCGFLSLVDGTQIIGPASNVVLVYLWFQEEFSTLGLLVQPIVKEVSWVCDSGWTR